MSERTDRLRQLSLDTEPSISSAQTLAVCVPFAALMVSSTTSPDSQVAMT